MKYIIILIIIFKFQISFCKPGKFGLPVEIQLNTFLRLYQVIKYLREHHPMRYNRMTEILKTVGSVQLSSAFLLKSHFLKRPLTMLAGVPKKTRVLPLRSKNAGIFEKLIGFARSHFIVTRGAVSLPCATRLHPSCFSKS